MSSKKKCEVCAENESKYKCPKCKVVYCSLACYKAHKDKCETQVETRTDDQPMRLEASDQNASSNTETLTNVPPGSSSTSIFAELSNAKTSEPDLKDIVSDFVSEDKLRLLGKYHLASP